MFSYPYSGLSLGSNVMLPELGPPGRSVSPHLHFTLSLETEEFPPVDAVPEGSWQQEWGLGSGQKYLSLGQWNQQYLFRFWANADFVVSSDAVIVNGYAQPGVCRATIRHLLLDQVLPSVLGRFGRKAIHASAVAFRGGVIAFLGESGYGKSSLAASFARQSLDLVADDCLVLQQSGDLVLASIAYPGVRLVPEAIATLIASPGPTLGVAHYSEKWRLPGEQAGRFSHVVQPLTHLFLLEDPARSGEAVEIRPMSAREAFLSLRQATFSLDAGEPTEAAAEFRLLGAAASQVSSYYLQYPRRWAGLDILHEAILRTVSDHSSRALGT